MWNEIVDATTKFLEGLKDEAETHATREVRVLNRVELRDTNIDLIELPSSFTSRSLYSRFCWERGYAIKADAKGKLPKLSEYPHREHDVDSWPPGSSPLPIPSWLWF